MLYRGPGYVLAMQCTDCDADSVDSTGICKDCNRSHYNEGEKINACTQAKKEFADDSFVLKNHKSSRISSVMPRRCALCEKEVNLSKVCYDLKIAYIAV